MIIYKNINGQKITEYQKNNSENYYEFFYDDNNILRTKYFYSYGKVIMGEYFVLQNENIDDALENLDTSIKWAILSNSETINTYTIWRQNFYINGILNIRYEKKVFDNNREIASVQYDDNNHAVGAVKTFYLEKQNIIYDDEIEGVFEDGDLVSFYFLVNGAISIYTNTNLFVKPYDSLLKFKFEQQGGPILSLMTPEMITYYTNLLPLVPNF